DARSAQMGTGVNAETSDVKCRKDAAPNIICGCFETGIDGRRRSENGLLRQCDELQSAAAASGGRDDDVTGQPRRASAALEFFLVVQWHSRIEKNVGAIA